jgi:hypothetical protein
MAASGKVGLANEFDAITVLPGRAIHNLSDKDNFGFFREALSEMPKTRLKYVPKKQASNSKTYLQHEVTKTQRKPRILTRNKFLVLYCLDFTKT